MINIESLNEIIYIIPDLVNLFLSGFIFMCIYTKLHNKQLDISLMVLWSLFISYAIKILYGAIHDFIYVDYIFNENLKTIIYIFTGMILPFIITVFYRSKVFRWILLKTNYQTTNLDIFDDVIDYKMKTIMALYLKDSDFYYMGTFSLREEKGKDSYIVLIDYALMNKTTNEVTHRMDSSSSVLINLNDIERIEVYYSTNSEVWKHLQDGN